MEGISSTNRKVPESDAGSPKEKNNPMKVSVASKRANSTLQRNVASPDILGGPTVAVEMAPVKEHVQKLKQQCEEATRNKAGTSRSSNSGDDSEIALYSGSTKALWAKHIVASSLMSGFLVSFAVAVSGSRLFASHNVVPRQMLILSSGVGTFLLSWAILDQMKYRKTPQKYN